MIFSNYDNDDDDEEDEEKPWKPVKPVDLLLVLKEKPWGWRAHKVTFRVGIIMGF